ncbi:MAG: hypothetical protein ACAH83_17115 [Alphaproteobacteria bacterium]
MKNHVQNMTTGVAMLAIAFTLCSCSNMNNTQQRVLSGGAIGAGAGAVGTAMTGGCVSCGAAIGGAVGAGAGYIYDQNEKQHGN